MRWIELKARLLEAGSARITGLPLEGRTERSKAGPSAGSSGSVFFSHEGRRVRLGIDPASPVELVHLGSGRAELHIDGETLEGRIEEVGLHCPRQAFVTVSEGCIFRCRYCPVPSQPPRVKSPEEVVKMVEGVIDRIDAISLTSGVVGSVDEDEARVLEVVKRLGRFGLPIGVSIYPGPHTPDRLYEAGVDEVKFNLETATPDIFAVMCPGLDWHGIREALVRSVTLFGRNHVFSNVILGLGETDEEMEGCIEDLTAMGVIPVIRPLNPVAGCRDFPRPDASRMLRIFSSLDDALTRARLDPREAKTMCVACTGCDLVPGRDA
jgi:biotin synthase-related radical SAM superfamily protein